MRVGTARPPYHLARQEHLGDMLDALRDRGRLNWRWGYRDRRAIFNLRLPGGKWHALDTKGAEQLVQAHCDELGIVWAPVPHPGGEDQRQAMLEALARGSTAVAAPEAGRN